ncbi:MAG: hypothetical protein ACJ8LD_08115 [Pantoea agglomerans]
MSSQKIDRFIKQLALSLVIGGVTSALVYGINEKTGVLIEVGSAISKSLSVIGAILISLLIKRFIDYQDKVKDIELSGKAPSSVVQSFDIQKEDYFKVSYRQPVNMFYMAFAALMVVTCLVLPLDAIKTKTSTLTFILADTGLTVATLSFLFFVGYEITSRTEEARKAKLHFERLKEMEVERQSLIDTLNKKLREQREADKKTNSKLRENKEFDLRNYLDGLENKKTDE